MVDPKSAVVTCPCGQQASYANTYYPGNGATDHVDVYQCPLGHVVQVFLPGCCRSKTHETGGSCIVSWSIITPHGCCSSEKTPFKHAVCHVQKEILSCNRQ